MIVAKRKAWKAWDPTQMTTLAWYDATDGTYITQTGGLVDQWDDRSGNTRHLAQAGAARPTYAASTVSFDGLAQYLVNALPFMYANGNLSVSCVAAINNAAGTDRRLVSERSTAATAPFYGFENHNTDGSQMCMYIRNDANTALRDHTPLSNTGAFNNTQRIYVWGDTGSRLMGFFNGAGAVHANYTRSGTLTPNRFGMGGTVGATPGAFLDCDVNELIITDFLDIQARQLMEGYLAWKWGLEASLPASHPFASCEPRLPKAP